MRISDWSSDVCSSDLITLSSQHVHVVDDDRDVRRSISFMLGTAELSYRPFGSGADFLESLGELQPGCILLDIRMPEIDGFEVMEELSRRGVDRKSTRLKYSH